MSHELLFAENNSSYALVVSAMLVCDNFAD